jgi:hypothetical protein
MSKFSFAILSISFFLVPKFKLLFVNPELFAFLGAGTPAYNIKNETTIKYSFPIRDL